MTRLPTLGGVGLSPLQMLGGGVGIQPLSFRASRQAALPILPPDVEESLMRRFVEGGMSGIASVANLLDLPGSSIRDIASSIATGKMVNPLDQYLTPFSAENRVTGRDLLTQLNLTAPRKQPQGSCEGRGWVRNRAPPRPSLPNLPAIQTLHGCRQSCGWRC
jgi:hypothetical protein